MALVAYGISSDEESDSENAENSQPAIHAQKEEDTVELNLFASLDRTNKLNSLKSLNLPEPLKPEFENTENTENIVSTLLFKKLPAPKSINTTNVLVEEDDEFLHKKATPITAEKRSQGRVKIIIPSLSEFKDVNNEKVKTKQIQQVIKKGCGLLGILPKPKDEMFTNFKPVTSEENAGKVAKLIPDSVRNRSSTVSSTQISCKSKNQPVLLETDDTDEDETNGDFFSLNSYENLPEVNMNEINAMVAKKVAKMTEASQKFDEAINIPPSITPQQEVNLTEPSSSQIVPEIDEKALHILVGSRAKRRKMEEVTIVDLSSAEVLPNKDEWLRTALASSTTYQPKGVLTDEELLPGTRKKHQITYLAHQAKANEMELQAMWSANRHTRRQTQGKYGF